MQTVSKSAIIKIIAEFRETELQIVPGNMINGEHSQARCVDNGSVPFQGNQPGGNRRMFAFAGLGIEGAYPNVKGWIVILYQ